MIALRSSLAWLIRHRILAAAIVIVTSAAALGLTQPLDNALSGMRAQLVQRAPSNTITVVEIDARSLAAAPQWPWPRSRYAQAIHNLRAAGAVLIGFDVDFSASSTPDQDDALDQAIDAAPGAIILPTFVQRGGEYQNSPLASITDNALLASVNVPVDGDGKVRRYQLGLSYDGAYNPSMAATLAGAPYGDASSFLIDYGIRAGEIDRLSFEDVVNNHFDPDKIRGRHILVGSTALELGDDFATPAAPSMPGVLVHALAFESLHQGRALKQINWLVTLLLGITALLFLWPAHGRRPRRSAIIRQVGVVTLALGAPIILQALAPISCDLGIILLAQGLALWATVQRELDKRAEALVSQLRSAALHDPETLLPNRRAMLQELERRLRLPDSSQLTVLAVGIDHFATMRGAIGYGKAVDLVRSLAELLGRRDAGESVFHLSTSILGIVLNASGAPLDRLCARLLSSFDTELEVGEHKIRVALRLGASTAGAASAEELLEQASVALDQARIRNCPQLRFDDSFPDPRTQLGLLADMSKGLERNEFYLVYQPKTHARDGDVVGVEALMRWRHPVDGSIMPDLFIAMAEDTGAIAALTHWSLHQAIADQARMREAGVSLTVSVNVSARTLGDVDFRTAAIAAIKHARADICFEITETAVIADPVAALETINAWRTAGIRISIDDYGAGLSSLSYLKQIAADELKIDKSLIGDLTRSARDRLIVKSTIDLAHSLGMCVIAEGVEDDATRSVLASMGCDCVQGYLVGRPQTLGQFIEMQFEDARRHSLKTDAALS